jgi:hypothetical protein
MTASRIDPRAIQRALNNKGFGIKEDGAIGPRTQAAMTRAVWDVVGSKSTLWPPERVLLAFEQIMLRDGGLDPGPTDGVMGPKTRGALAEWASRQVGGGNRVEFVTIGAGGGRGGGQSVMPFPTSFSGPARRLTPEDIAAAAKSIGCEVAALRAVIGVESRGAGFDARDRPVILFEPHVFYRQLAKRPRSTYDTGLNRAVMAGLAYKAWRRGSYPGGSPLQQSDANYARLSRAMAIHPESAFRAISIGMGQVLGENHDAAGFPSAVAMFEAAKESEAAQLAQMLGFIKENRLDDDIRAKRWETFARAYNGPGQVVMYGGKLAAAYRQFA